LKQKGDGFAEQLIYLSTPNTTAFTVNVYKGTSTTILTTLTVSKSSPATYNPGNGDNNITLLTADSTGKRISSSGLKFVAPNGEKFYVNWRGKSGSQASSLTSKGRAALGKAFKWVGIPNRGAGFSLLTNAVGIMATENNTTVNIFGYNTNCTFRDGSNEAGNTADEQTITLNAGQTFVLEAAVTSLTTANRTGWIGASITSDKDIALYLQSLPDISKGGDVNQQIREGYKKQFDRANAKLQFMQGYFDQYGHLNGADVMWQKEKSKLLNPSSSNANQPAMANQDQQAIEWANSNPNDPRATLIKQRLGVR
jgi:hypothetical protein